ncbi:DUF494 family protein [Pelagibaculum spongiae]|uniref:Protein Smg homolog n=1 Tax=Pelagibaculum spongiae TaxID=2080658 RepID=A0A2V1GT30_9GAMM|nr:DUF494 domain-containing protein [Pelagibaculum spongiae]PVZ68174.1 hypothetical protein DC094_12800 [Pelagibaculum spongiae]
MLDVLMYLFDHFMESESGWHPVHDQLIQELEQAGFPGKDIRHALDWIDGLDSYGQQAMLGSSVALNSVRIFNGYEQQRLDTESRGMLVFLEQEGVLDPAIREMVMDRLMAFDGSLDVEHVKWAALLVLCSIPGQEAALAWMEDMVFEGRELLMQ